MQQQFCNLNSLDQSCDMRSNCIARVEQFSEQKKALQESEQQFRTLTNCGNALIWTSDTNKLCDYFNQPWLNFTGKTIDQEIGNGWAEGLHPDDLDKCIDIYTSAFDRRENFSMDYRLLHRSGEYRWIQDDGCPRFDSEGNFIGYIGHCLDITERKQMEALIRKSEERYRALFENMIDGFAYCKMQFNDGKPVDFTYLIVNDAFTRLSGLTDVIDRKISEVIPGFCESNPKIIETYGRVALTGNPEKFESYVGQLGAYFFVTVYCPEKEHFVAIFENITEQKKLIEETHIAAAAFETHDAIVITNADGNIIKVNQAFTDITGYTQDEVLGKNPRLMSSGRHDKQYFAEMFEKLQNQGIFEGEIWDKRKNGEIYPRWMKITAIRDDQQTINKYVGIFSDITDRKKNEELINRLAFFDTLTQLPNRRMLIDRMRQAMSSNKRNGKHGAVLFIDLDNFKPLNDKHGHDVGDLLLVEVGRRISSCIRGMDTVSRFGGDEFVVMLSELSGVESTAINEAGIVAEKIRITLSEVYSLNYQNEDSTALLIEYCCSSSIGGTIFNGQESSPDPILKRADIAMYQAKSAGRNSVRFYE